MPLLIAADGFVIAGHAVLEAAQRLGYTGKYPLCGSHIPSPNGARWRWL